MTHRGCIRNEINGKKSDVVVPVRRYHTRLLEISFQSIFRDEGSDGELLRRVLSHRPHLPEFYPASVIVGTTSGFISE